MNNFENELERIFSNLREGFPQNKYAENNFSDLKEEIFKKFETAKKFLNDKFEFNAIETMKLTNNILSLLFNVERGEGFLISFEKSKLVLALFEDESFMTFVGRSENSLAKNIKLLRLKIIGEENKNYYFKDNSGSSINIDEVVIQVMNWGLN